ncbi:MAG: sodium:solute symporter, partial [Desulfotomaculum sp. BICA1-6]
TVITKPDQIIFILNVIYNPEWVTAFVVGGALAAGLSTVAGNLMAVAALVGHDLLSVFAPNMETKTKLRIGYVALGLGGLIAILLAFNPPKFLVTSILWAFGLLASAVTPAILLGVWWKEANRLAMFISSLFCGITYIIISPHVLPNIVVGNGVTAALGMASGLITVPLSFGMFIILSLIFNRIPALSAYAPTEEDKRMIDRIHGWGDDYDEKRYASVVWPLIAVVGCVAVFFWGMVPWA